VNTGFTVTGISNLGTGSTNYVQISGSGGEPVIAPNGAGSNISLALQGKGTGIIDVSSRLVPNGGILVPQSTVLSGGTGTTWAILGSNLSGTYTGGAGPAVVTINNATDTAALTNPASGGYPSLRVNRQFGGVGTFGGRFSFDCQLWCSAAITGDTSSQQYQAGNFAAKATVNVGGTNDSVPGDGRGFLYGSAFYGSLQSGATNWALVNAQGETDIEVYSNNRTLTVGGTVTSGDVLTVTFTGAGITGSPLSVNYTVQTGNTLYNITQNIVSAIQNTAALSAAGISAGINSFNLTGPATISWNTNSTVTVSVSTSGGATETLTLGSVVAGGSTHRKLGASIVRLLTDNQAGGESTDTGLVITAQGGCSPLAGWNVGLGFGGAGSEWPFQKTGTLILAQQRTSNGGTRTTYAIPPLLTRGLDMSGVNFVDQNGYSLIAPGFSVAGNGSLSVGNAALSYSSAGLSVDATGYVASGNASIVSGGSSSAGSIVGNYFAGDIVFDPLGGQHRVTSISTTTGQVTGLTTIVQPFTSGSLPATNQATTGGSGLGLTIGITWVAATTIKLNPSGGAIQPGSGAWTANGAVATALSSVGPSGAHTTVQEWFTVKNASGTVRYIPAF